MHFLPVEEALHGSSTMKRENATDTLPDILHTPAQTRYRPATLSQGGTKKEADEVKVLTQLQRA